METELKRGLSKFTYVGKVKLSEKTFAMEQKGVKNQSYIYNSLNLGINCSGTDSNVCYAKLMGGHNLKNGTKLYAHGWKQVNNKAVPDFNNRVEVPFNDRFNDTLLSEVADDCFITIGILKDVDNKTIVKKYLSAYDAIKYLQENLKEDMVVSVRGDMKFSTYNGNTTNDRTITSIWLSSAESKDFRATFDQTVLFTQDSFGNKVDEEGFLPLYVKVIDYDKEAKTNIPFSWTLYLDTNKMPRYKDIIKQFLCPKKKNGVNKIGVIGAWIKTDNTVEITPEDLASDLKMLVEIGMMNTEEAMGRAIGNVRSITKTILKSLATKKNENGVDTLVIDTDSLTIDDLIVDKPPFDTGEEELKTNTVENNSSSKQDEFLDKEAGGLFDEFFN